MRSGNEEDIYEDLSSMLELLAELMASQYEGLGTYKNASVHFVVLYLTHQTAWADILEKRGEKAPSNYDVGDVVFYGIDIIIPLITEKMLQVL